MCVIVRFLQLLLKNIKLFPNIHTYFFRCTYNDSFFSYLLNPNFFYQWILSPFTFLSINILPSRVTGLCGEAKPCFFCHHSQWGLSGRACEHEVDSCHKRRGDLRTRRICNLDSRRRLEPHWLDYLLTEISWKSIISKWQSVAQKWTFHIQLWPDVAATAVLYNYPSLTAGRESCSCTVWHWADETLRLLLKHDMCDTHARNLHVVCP